MVKKLNMISLALALLVSSALALLISQIAFFSIRVVWILAIPVVLTAIPVRYPESLRYSIAALVGLAAFAAFRYQNVGIYYVPSIVLLLICVAFVARESDRLVVNNIGLS